ncbi:MAG: hypothetical protein IAF38_11740 [Bacteroidia bacterium]|nr:hypothetical protein [Bacteroidia bacterium]
MLVLINGRQKQVDNFNCEICSDKAGYYFYLPAVFQMGFSAANYEKDFDHKHGDGFYFEEGKVKSKFSCGVALMQTPFYAAGALISKTFSLNKDPYSNYYLFFISIGAAFYCILGLFFMRKWLQFYCSAKTALLAVLLVFFGTNLLYYTLDESLMSHLYSFSLFSGVLFAIKSFSETKSFRFFILFSICFSLAILIRPTNILFGLFALLLDFKNIKTKLSLLLSLKNIITAVIIFLLILLPQLLYWKFAFGKYLVWSYKGEGFTNWNRPEFLIVWFSPQSGLFAYTPLIFFILILSIVMILKKIPNGVLVLFSFFIVSYLCAAWHQPFFGVCNFGKRPMIEYLPLLMLPFALMLENFKTYNRTIRYSISAILVLCVYYNLALFSGFNTCFFGDTWDWHGFFELFKKGMTIIR